MAPQQPVSVRLEFGWGGEPAGERQGHQARPRDSQTIANLDRRNPFTSVGGDVLLDELVGERSADAELLRSLLDRVQQRLPAGVGAPACGRVGISRPSTDPSATESLTRCGCGRQHGSERPAMHDAHARVKASQLATGATTTSRIRLTASIPVPGEGGQAEPNQRLRRRGRGDGRCHPFGR
jgi:hypothetical protein